MSVSRSIDRGACSLKEMCEQDRKDAERYRWLREKVYVSGDDFGSWFAVDMDDFPLRPLHDYSTPAMLDASIDGALIDKSA